MKSVHRRTAIGFFALLVTASLFPAASQAQSRRAGDSARLTGRIQSLSTSGSSFVLDSDDEDFRITVEATGAAIRDRNDSAGTRYRLRDLDRGEVVDVFGTWIDSRTVRADRIERSHLVARGYDDDRRNGRGGRGNSQWGRDERTRDGLTGTVTGSTGNLSRNMRVEVNGRTYTVEVPRNITVRRDGRESSIHNLKAGDRVRVTGDWNDDRLRADRVEARSDVDSDDRPSDRTYTGVVERLDSRSETFRLRTSSRTYDVDARDADLRDGSRTRRFSDLRNGDRVTVYVDRASGSRLIADRVQWGSRYDDDDEDRDDRNSTVGGTVGNLDYLNRTFRLQMSLGTVTVRVANDTDIRDEEGDRISFRELRSGMRVRVRGSRSGSGGTFTADRIDVND